MAGRKKKSSAGTEASRYRHPALRKLAEQQVRFAPVSVRMTQLDRTEELLLTINASDAWFYPDLCEAITGYRSEMYPDLEISGTDLLRDLRCFLEDLSDSANLRSEDAPEEVLTIEQVSEEFQVSTKTIQRWRDRGLASRRYLFGARKRIGIRRSAVSRFVAAHADDVARGGSFSQLSEEQRVFIIRRARRLARYGASLTEVSRRISRRLGRAHETIRYTLKNYDRDHPEAAIFPPNRPVTAQERREIYQALRRGTPPSRLAVRYRRSRSSIHRIATEYRVKMLIERPIEFVPSAEFEELGAADWILNPPEDLKLPADVPVTTGDELPAYLSELYSLPLLTREQEQFLFRKMNFLKYQAATIRDHLPRSRHKTVDMEEIERLFEAAGAVKNLLIQCNLRLVVSIARKHRRPGSNFFELISDGNMTLIRAIERFDYSLGNKFSTYATWSIMRSFAQTLPAEGVHKSRFRTGTDELFTGSADKRTTMAEDESRASRQREAIESILDGLNEREQEAITLRFALEGQAEPLTLEQIGDRIGVSKERARQIIGEGLEKLRAIAEASGMDLPS